MIIIYTVGGVVGFALSSFAGAYLPGILFLRGGAVHRRRLGVDRRA